MRPRTMSSTTMGVVGHPQAHDVTLAGAAPAASLSSGEIARPAPEYR